MKTEQPNKHTIIREISVVRKKCTWQIKIGKW